MTIKTTTTRNGPKPFAWSYSKLKNYESCPKRHWHIDIAKDVKEEESDQLLYGNAIHKALAEACSGKAPLPAPHKALQKWVDRITNTGPGTVLVEQQMAITKDFGPTGWFDRDAWYRGIGDVLKMNGPVGVVLDWKTGKILEDGVQLALMAACVFAHHPEIMVLRTEFIWLKEDASTRVDFTRADMPGVWNSVLPRVKRLEEAVTTVNYPPKPGYLCRKWCPVRQCPHNGE